VNIGNLMFLNKEYPKALGEFNRAIDIFNKKGLGSSTGAIKVMLNISSD